MVVNGDRVVDEGAMMVVVVVMVVGRSRQAARMVRGGRRRGILWRSGEMFGDGEGTRRVGCG